MSQLIFGIIAYMVLSGHIMASVGEKIPVIVLVIAMGLLVLWDVVWHRK